MTAKPARTGNGPGADSGTDSGGTRGVVPTPLAHEARRAAARARP
jgi:hypothetical protein